MAFHGLDYYGIDELYTDEERMIRDTVRDFVSAKVMPGIGKHFSAGTFPRELIPMFGELGLLGPSLTGYGCPGTSATAYGLICQELERGDSGIRSFCSVQSSLVTLARSDHLPWMSRAVNPFDLVGTRKPCTLPSSLAQTSAT